LGLFSPRSQTVRLMRERSAAKQGGEPFAALYADPDRLRQFLSAMTGITSGTAG